jgi:hypothetical protein
MTALLFVAEKLALVIALCVGRNEVIRQLKAIAVVKESKMTDERIVRFPWPEHVEGWNMRVQYDGTFDAFVIRKFDLRDNYGRILGPSLSASARGATPWEAMTIALNLLEKKTQDKLAEQNANPPTAHPIIQQEADDLAALLGL